mgnify:CR=1 FL=1
MAVISSFASTAEASPIDIKVIIPEHEVDGTTVEVTQIGDFYYIFLSNSDHVRTAVLDSDYQVVEAYTKIKSEENSLKKHDPTLITTTEVFDTNSDGTPEFTVDGVLALSDQINETLDDAENIDVSSLIKETEIEFSTSTPGWNDNPPPTYDENYSTFSPLPNSLMEWWLNKIYSAGIIGSNTYVIPGENPAYPRPLAGDAYSKYPREVIDYILNNPIFSLGDAIPSEVLDCITTDLANTVMFLVAKTQFFI